jgi:hypothetical protein
MIKFFRKIRYDLMEKNKTGKYFKYAIGEIILVVIGILIALQINNWNEKQKNAKLVSTYKKNLIVNLTQDSLNISNALMNINNELETIEEFENRVSKSSKPFDTILKIARYEYNFLISVNYDYEDNTYKILNSTGHLGLFNQDITQELNKLYNLQEKALFATIITGENHMNSLNYYSKKYPFSFKNNLIRNGTIASKEVWDNISLPNHATEFNALIISKSDSYRLSLLQLPLLKEQTNRLLKILHESN